MPARAGLEVLLFDLGAHSGLLERAERECGLLSPDELGGRAGEGPLGGERRLARIALRLTLAAAGEADAVGCELARSAAGKPFMPRSSLAFSVSHAAGRVLIAMAAGGPVGVDIEPRRQLRMPELRVQQIVEAASALCADIADMSDAADRSIAAWCVLEAYAKAEGDGIAALLGALGIMGPGGRSRSVADVKCVTEVRHAQALLRVATIDAGSEMAAALCAPQRLLDGSGNGGRVAAPLGADGIESMISLAGRHQASSG